MPVRALRAPLRRLAAAGCLAAAPAFAACPPAQPQALVERFIPADCAACWGAAPPDPAPGRTRLALDWIVPAPPGVDAALGAAALLDAAPRAAREGRLASDETLARSHPLPAASAIALTVESGPALNGYVAMRLVARYAGQRPLPAGLTGWLALVERVDAGEEGTPVDRLVVRALAGPLVLEPLAREPVEHLVATRVPETGRAERLMAVGWVETAKGRAIAVSRSVDDACPLR